MNFSEAKEAAIRGAKIRRQGWRPGSYVWVNRLSYLDSWGDTVSKDLPVYHCVEAYGEDNRSYFAGGADRDATDWEIIA